MHDSATMTEYFLANEAQIRAALFIMFFLTIALTERIFPFRNLAENVYRHYFRNLFVVMLGTPIVRVLFPILAVSSSIIAERNGWGALHHVALPTGIKVVVTIILMDLAIYWQHRIFHTFPWLWRLHRMHHSDRDFDVSTGVRFHPIEIALSMGVKIGTVFALGASPIGVLLFEILLSATSLFSHANFRLPKKLEAFVRGVFVTPDMHRVHHSIRREETDSNFGFNFSTWDRVFRSYKANSIDGDRQVFGVDGFREPNQLTLVNLLLQPFRK